MSHFQISLTHPSLSFPPERGFAVARISSSGLSPEGSGRSHSHRHTSLTLSAPAYHLPRPAGAGAPQNKTNKYNTMNSVIIDIKREYESGNRESWHKAFSAIDRTQSGARAFTGTYLKPGEHRLEVGSLIVHVIPTGSVEHRSEVAVILRVTETQTLEPLTERFQWREQQCSLQDLAETLLGENAHGQVACHSLAGFSVEELELELQTRRELVA